MRPTALRAIWGQQKRNTATKSNTQVCVRAKDMELRAVLPSLVPPYWEGSMEAPSFPMWPAVLIWAVIMLFVWYRFTWRAPKSGVAIAVSMDSEGMMAGGQRMTTIPVRIDQ